MRKLMIVFALLMMTFSMASAQKPTKEPPVPIDPSGTNTTSSGGTLEDVVVGAALINETFDSTDVWENYSDMRGVDMRVENGTYRVLIPGTTSDTFVWALNDDLHTDVSLTVETFQASENIEATYGVMCRADITNDGRGYYFMINGDGSAYIAKPIEDSVTPISDVVLSDAINLGTTPNTLQAVCVGDQLKLIVNGEVIVETTDTQYVSGFAGFAASAHNSIDTDATFDNLSINEAALGDTTVVIPEPTPTSSGTSTTTTASASVPEIAGITAGAVLLNEPFDAADAWENFTSEGTNLRVEDGAYRVTRAVENIIWGQNLATHTDAIIYVETKQQSALLNNAYGVMCRASVENDGNGYYFLISGDGFYSIAKKTGGFGGTIDFLVEWTSSNLINQGQLNNTITAACVGDRLILYINGQFATETTDSQYTEGVVGLTAGPLEAGEADIVFDNVQVIEAQ